MTRVITPTPNDVAILRALAVSGADVTAAELAATFPSLDASKNALNRAAERGWVTVSRAAKGSAYLYQISAKGKHFVEGEKAPKAGPRTVSVMAGTYTGAKQSATRPGAEDFLRIPSRGLGT